MHAFSSIFFTSLTSFFILISVNSALSASEQGSQTEADKPRTVEANKIYTGDDQQEISLESIAQQIKPGSIVIVSEYHGHSPHHENQRKILKALVNAGQTHISVGMEFFEYPQQNLVDSYLAGTLSEKDFLAQISWGLPAFDFYRDQVLFPSQANGWSIALNSPRWLNSKVGKLGLKALTPEELSVLPPQFTIGNAEYLERFAEAMGGHVPPEKLENYFAAQSIWDDTMAWRAVEFINKNPNQVLVIIVGDFHNAYESGLPERLKARGAQSVVTISQADIFGMTPQQAWQEVAPHPTWGRRADYIWVSSEQGKFSVLRPFE